MNLNELKTTELKQLGKQFQLKGWWNMKKDELVSTIEKVVSASDEALEILNEYEREQAAIAEYITNWTKYTKRHNVSEFLEKWKSGEIVLESERAAGSEQTETLESRSNDISDIEHINNQDEPENATENESGASEHAPKRDNKIEKEEIEPFIYTDADGNEWEDEEIGEIIKDWPEEKKAALAEEYNDLGDFDINKWSKEWNKTHGKTEEKKDGHKPTPKRGALIEFNGKSQNIVAWGKELGISANTLYGRIYKLGWSVEKAFTKK